MQKLIFFKDELRVQDKFKAIYLNLTDFGAKISAQFLKLRGWRSANRIQEKVQGVGT